MTSRTHDLAAFTAISFVVATQPLDKITLATGLVALLGNMIGGILPDIDQPTAPFWRTLPIGGVIGRVFDPVLGGHRFISHSIVGILFFGIVWHYLLVFLQPSLKTIDINIVWWAFMIGYVSHLVMDTITKEGVPWLLPIPIKFGVPPFKALRVKTGGLIENFVILPALILVNIYLYSTHYNKVLDVLHHHVK